jgi:hypothetical protein
MAWHSFRFRFVYNGNCSAGRIEIAVLDEFPVNRRPLPRTIAKVTRPTTASIFWEKPKISNHRGKYAHAGNGFPLVSGPANGVTINPTI